MRRSRVRETLCVGEHEDDGDDNDAGVCKREQESENKKARHTI